MNIAAETLRKLGIALVILHAIVITPHSVAHTNLYIWMGLWQNIFIILVILTAPIIAALLLWKKHRIGFPLLGTSMFCAFLFGAFYHFIAIGSDNVFTVPPGPWTTTFQVSALLLALTEIGGAVVGLLGTIKESEQPKLM